MLSPSSHLQLCRQDHLAGVEHLDLGSHEKLLLERLPHLSLSLCVCVPPRTSQPRVCTKQLPASEGSPDADEAPGTAVAATVSLPLRW